MSNSTADPSVLPRRPLLSLFSDKATGYLESDNDYVFNNLELCVLMLDRLAGDDQP